MTNLLKLNLIIIAQLELVSIIYIFAILFSITELKLLLLIYLLLLVPKLPVDTSPCREDEIKLERKRRQQQKKEEFLQQLKQKQHHINNGISNKENGTNVGKTLIKQKMSF